MGRADIPFEATQPNSDQANQDTDSQAPDVIPDVLLSATTAQMFETIDDRFELLVTSPRFPLLQRGTFNHIGLSFQQWLACYHENGRKRLGSMLPLGLLIAIAMNDHASVSGEKAGQARWICRDFEYVAFADRQWAQNEKAEYRSKTPIARLALSGPASGMLWNRCDAKDSMFYSPSSLIIRSENTELALILPVVPQIVGETSYRFRFDVHRRAVSAACTGRGGPMVLLLLENDVVFSSLQEIVESESKLSDGRPMFAYEHSEDGESTHIEGLINLRDPACRPWERGKFLAMDDRLAYHLNDILREKCRALRDGARDTGVRTVTWGRLRHYCSG